MSEDVRILVGRVRNRAFLGLLHLDSAAGLFSDLLRGEGVLDERVERMTRDSVRVCGNLLGNVLVYGRVKVEVTTRDKLEWDGWHNERKLANRGWHDGGGDP